LTLIERQDQGRRQVVLTSAERFELRLDETGIVAWYNLQRDSTRATNLVEPGARLLEHRYAGDTSLLRGTLQIEQQTPLRVRLTWTGQAGPAAEPFRVEYTVWAGGQVTLNVRSRAAINSTLRRDNDAITGAVLQDHGAAVGADGTSTRSLTLFLNAWTREATTVPRQGPLSAVGFAAHSPQRGTLRAPALPGGPVRLVPPPGMVRQPRFEIAGWPGGDLSIQRAGRTLVYGADYLADYEPASNLLTFQYLHLLPQSADITERTFTVSASGGEPALALGIAGRDVDENGLMLVDGNLPGVDDVPPYQTQSSTADLFRIPYIQSTSQVTARATVQNAPASASVRFVLNNSVVKTVAVPSPDASVQASFDLVLGEHSLQAQLLDGNGAPVPGAAATINPLGYGVVLQTIGDSITAGKWGNYISPGAPDFPVTSYVGQAPGNYSADRRNIFQYDNYWINGQNTYYYRGYQVTLNNLLTSCYQRPLPIFVLNDGVSSLRAANPPSGNQTRGSEEKVPALNDHIAALGVQQTLIMLGTNDSSSGATLNTWRAAMNQLIDGLQSPNAGLHIWVARVPFRADVAAGSAELQLINTYNAAIPAMVAAQNTARNPVSEGPDFYTWFSEHQNELIDLDQISNTPDNLHPTSAGMISMANLWRDKLCPALPEPPPPGTTPTPPTPTPPPTPAPVRLPFVSRPGG
jgi:lysophospholipase L1-like esterase